MNVESPDSMLSTFARDTEDDDTQPSDADTRRRQAGIHEILCHRKQLLLASQHHDDRWCRDAATDRVLEHGEVVIADTVVVLLTTSARVSKVDACEQDLISLLQENTPTFALHEEANKRQDEPTRPNKRDPFESTSWNPSLPPIAQKGGGCHSLVGAMEASMPYKTYPYADHPGRVQGQQVHNPFFDFVSSDLSRHITESNCSSSSQKKAEETSASEVELLRKLGSTLPSKRTPYVDVAHIRVPNVEAPSRGGYVELFPQRLHYMLGKAEIEGFQDVVSWLPHNRAFRVHNLKRFSAEVLPRFFSGIQYASWLRQLSVVSRRCGRRGDKRGPKQTGRVVSRASFPSLTQKVFCISTAS